MRRGRARRGWTRAGSQKFLKKWSFEDGKSIFGKYSDDQLRDEKGKWVSTKTHEDIQDIVPVIAHWLDEIESQASSMIALALTGTIEAVLWIAIFGDDEIATPDLPDELDTRARRAGVQILLENYTTPDPEDGNSAKLFLGASRQR